MRKELKESQVARGIPFFWAKLFVGSALGVRFNKEVGKWLSVFFKIGSERHLGLLIIHLLKSRY